MMKKAFVLIIFTTILFGIAPAQTVKWYTFSEAIELNKKEPRSIIIDVYTDWCHWCKVMDQQTFSNATIAKILNEKYYAVKFNAEQKEDIVFQGHTFKNTGEGRRPPHELAVAMLNGKLSYPSIVFMNKQNQLITAVPGFQKPDQMEPLLIYIHNEMYVKNVDYQEFLKNYKSNANN